MTSPYSERFEAFWQAYKCMRRVKKLEAWAEWRKVGGDDIHADIMDGLARFKRTDQWVQQYQPEPARWLKHMRWTDEAEPQDDAQVDDGWKPQGPPRG